MNAPVIISPAVAQLDAAQLQRADDLDASGGFFLKHRIGSAWITMGLWYCPRDAMKHADGAPSWISVSPFTWMSTDGRWIVKR